MGIEAGQPHVEEPLFPMDERARAYWEECGHDLTKFYSWELKSATKLLLVAMVFDALDADQKGLLAGVVMRDLAAGQVQGADQNKLAIAMFTGMLDAVGEIKENLPKESERHVHVVGGGGQFSLHVPDRIDVPDRFR